MSVFTIITVCFNAQDLISDTMISVYSQTYKSIEYIIVDGLSKDNTIQVIEKTKELYDKNNITKIISEKDNGIYDAMNKGVRYSSGRYCCFLNAGDTFASPDVLSFLAEIVDRCNYGFIYGDVYSKGKTFKKYVAAQPMDVVSDSFQMPYCHQALFVSKELALKYAFDPDYRNAADYNQCIQLYKSGTEYFHADIVVADYQIGGKSESDALNYFDEKAEIRKRNGFTNPSQVQCLLFRFKLKIRIFIKRVLPASAVELIRRANM